MRWEDYMGERVSDAARAGLCLVLYNTAYYYRDEAHKQWRKEVLLNWLEDAEDIKYTIVYMTQSRTAFIFEDHFYKRLFMLYFGITFKWD